MSLEIKQGDRVLSPMSSQPRKHHVKECEWNIDFDPTTGILALSSRGGAPFMKVDWARRLCTVDVLNVPYVDVSKRVADVEKLVKK